MSKPNLDPDHQLEMRERTKLNTQPLLEHLLILPDLNISFQRGPPREAFGRPILQHPKSCFCHFPRLRFRVVVLHARENGFELKYAVRCRQIERRQILIYNVSVLAVTLTPRPQLVSYVFKTDVHGERLTPDWATHARRM